MSELKTIRINKVLRELNISLDRAVEQLAEHGLRSRHVNIENF